MKPQIYKYQISPNTHIKITVEFIEEPVVCDDVVDELHPMYREPFLVSDDFYKNSLVFGDERIKACARIWAEYKTRFRNGSGFMRSESYIMAVYEKYGEEKVIEHIRNYKGVSSTGIGEILYPLRKQLLEEQRRLNQSSDPAWVNDFIDKARQ